MPQRAGLASAIVMFMLVGASLSAQTIDMDQFFYLARNGHPLFEREGLTPVIEGEKSNAYLGDQNMIVRFAPYYSQQHPLALSAFTPTRLSQISAGGQLEKAFWNTGGRLSLGWTSDFIDQTLEPIQFGDIVIPTGESEYFQNRLALTYTQPLLQNFRGALDRLRYEVSQYGIGMATAQSRENQEAFLLEMGLKFIDWVVLTEQRKIAQDRLALLRKQLEQVTSKRKANLVDRVDVLRSEDALRLAEQSVVLVEAQWLAKQAELAVLTGSEAIYSQIPKFDLYRRVTRPPVEAYLEKLKAQSRPLQLLSLRRDMLHRQEQGLLELTRPQLLLSSQVSLNGGDAAFDNSTSLNKRDAGLFLQFRYPLGNEKARADVRSIRLQSRQLALESSEISLSLEAALRSLMIQADQMEKVLSLNEGQIETARQRTEAEQERYNQGRGDLTFVIQGQDNEERAALSYAQNAANYHRLNLHIRALMDQLVAPQGEQAP